VITARAPGDGGGGRHQDDRRTPGTAPTAEQAAAPADTVAAQLRRRVQAARRLPPLPSDHVDPLVPADHGAWQAEHDLAMARAGLAPPWQAERARRLWRDCAR
jgi:hypothetical protein